MTAESPYLTTAEALVYLRLGSESALYRLIRQHRLPHTRRGGRYLFDTRELDAWLRGFENALEQTRSAKAEARATLRMVKARL